MKIRRGKISDIKELHYLLNNVKEIRDFEGGEEYPESWVKDLLKNEKENIVLISENEEGKLIGFLVAFLQTGVKEAILNNLYVDENYRRSRVATDLLKMYESELKRRGFIFSMALAKTDNTAIQEFNENNGYKRGDEFYFYYKWI